MKPETRIALAPIDRYTLIAHETAALICTDADALGSAVQLREGMAIAASVAGLDEEAAPLLCWIDREVESAREFAATGQDTPHLIDPDLLFPVPDTAAQMDVVWILFQSAVECPLEQRQTLLNAARIFTELGGMEDMLLGIRNPGAEFLAAKDLRSELEKVRTALQTEQAPGLSDPIRGTAAECRMSLGGCVPEMEM